MYEVFMIGISKLYCGAVEASDVSDKSNIELLQDTAKVLAEPDPGPEATPEQPQ